jgi:hypothetical protein
VEEIWSTAGLYEHCIGVGGSTARADWMKCLKLTSSYYFILEIVVIQCYNYTEFGKIMYYA